MPFSLVPVFDGSTGGFTMNGLDRIGKNLSLFKGEITRGSAVIVGHSMFTVVKPSSSIPQLVFGLQWIIVVALAERSRMV